MFCNKIVTFEAILPKRPLLGGDPFAQVQDLQTDAPDWNGLSSRQLMRLKSACEQRIKSCTRKGKIFAMPNRVRMKCKPPLKIFLDKGRKIMPQNRPLTSATWIDLFSSEKGDELYKHLKSDNTIWHKYARNYFNKIYNEYKMFLDDKFIQQFPHDLLSCLWKLKLLVHINSIKQGRLLPSLMPRSC